MLAFDRWGRRSQPSVVLLHSIATNRHLWDLQTAVLAQHFDVLRLDLPGHGQSAAGPSALDGFADAVLSTLDAADVRQAALVGLSLGGMVAQSIALKAPERINALVLANTSARTAPEAIGLWQQRGAAAEHDGMQGQLEGTLARWFTPQFRAQAPATVAWISAMIAATPVDGYQHAISAIQSLDFSAALHAMRARTLVLTGEQDAATPPAVARGIAQAIPGAQLEVLADAAHLSNVQQATAFTERVALFLGS